VISATHIRRGEVAFHQVRGLTAVALDRADNELASAHIDKASLRHQPRDALAADAHSLDRQLGIDGRRTVGAARGRMRRRISPINAASVSARRDGRREETPSSRDMLAIG